MSSPVILINVFEVPVGTESDFIAWWKKSSEALQGEPGFIEATLHHSLKPESRFQFINVARWETEESLAQARIKNKDILQSLSVGKGTPSLYEVAFRY